LGGVVAGSLSGRNVELVGNRGCPILAGLDTGHNGSGWFGCAETGEGAEERSVGEISGGIVADYVIAKTKDSSVDPDFGGSFGTAGVITSSIGNSTALSVGQGSDS